MVNSPLGEHFGDGRRFFREARVPTVLIVRFGAENFALCLERYVCNFLVRGFSMLQKMIDNLSSRGWKLPRQYFHQYRFAGAVGADDGPLLVAFYLPTSPSNNVFPSRRIETPRRDTNGFV